MSATARKPRRILIVSPWEDFWSMPGKAGVSDDAEFTRRALAAGHELHFVIPAGGRFHPEEEHARLHVHPFPNIFPRTRWLPTPLRRLLWFGYFAGPVIGRALRVAREVEPELVLGFSYHGARAAERNGRELAIPSVVKHFGVYTATFFDEWPRWKYLWKNLETLDGLRRRVDRLIVLNDGTRGRETAIHAGFPAERVVYLRNGIHTEWAALVHDHAAERSRLGVKEDEIAVLFLARLDHFKGTAQLARVLPQLFSETGRSLRLLIAGSGPDEDGLRADAARLAEPERVRFLGAVPHDEVPRLFAAADLFLTINTYSNGSIPTSEAMVCGVPVLASDVAGTAETVIHEETGLLVPHGDDDALLAALRRLACEDELRARLGEGARHFAEEHFDSWDERVERELALVDELCEQGRTIS